MARRGPSKSRGSFTKKAAGTSKAATKPQNRKRKVPKIIIRGIGVREIAVQDAQGNIKVRRLNAAKGQIIKLGRGKTATLIQIALEAQPIVGHFPIPGLAKIKGAGSGGKGSTTRGGGARRR